MSESRSNRTPGVSRQHAYLTQEEIDAQLQHMSREPFRAMLNRILQSQPDIASLAAFAKKHPDRWGQLLAVVAKLTGFNEKIDVDLSITAKVRDMSDAEIVAELQRMDREIETLKQTNTLPSHGAETD